jgi:hypothetical protein
MNKKHKTEIFHTTILERVSDRVSDRMLRGQLEGTNH